MSALNRGSDKCATSAWRWRVAVLLGCAMALAGGCTGEFYKRRADKETYGIIKDKEKAVHGASSEFSIESGRQGVRESFPSATKPYEPPLDRPDEAAKDDGPAETKPMVLPLAECLRLATLATDRYQREKETLYLSGLALTLARHRYTPIFSSLLSGELTRSGPNENRQWDADSSGTLRIAKNFATGATASLSYALNFARIVSTGDKADITASLEGNLVQPLLRGAWPRVALENLTQAERDTIYAVRRFARFKQTFAVQVASDFYRALQREDELRNEWKNYQNLMASRERAEGLAQAGRMRELEVDQARQDELRARDRWIRALQTYQTQIDQFKLSLGLTTDANVIPDRKELDLLAQRGIVPVKVELEEAIEIAFGERFDLMTSRDLVADADRKVYVAKHNATLPELSVEFDAQVNSKAPRNWTHMQFHESTYSVGSSLNPRFDRKADRNTYRQALITHEQTKRQLEDQIDQIKLEVRGAFRRLREAEQTHEIQRTSLELARRRVESAELMLQAGRATTRDLLEAREALVRAQNAVTAALISHRLERLNFERDIGRLRILEDGKWEGYEDQPGP